MEISCIKLISASRNQINSSSENSCTILEWNETPSFQSGANMRSLQSPGSILYQNLQVNLDVFIFFKWSTATLLSD